MSVVPGVPQGDGKTGDSLGDQVNLEYTALSKRLYENKVESKDQHLRLTSNPQLTQKCVPNHIHTHRVGEGEKKGGRNTDRETERGLC